MVKRKKTVLITIVIVTVVFIGGWLYLKTTPKARIRQRCHDLAEQVSSSARQDSGRSSSLKMFGLRNFFAEECRLELSDFQHNGTYTPEEIAGSVARLRKRVTSLAVHLNDLDVTLKGDARAQVGLTARVEVKRSGQARQRSNARELNCSLQKQEGDWVFTRFKEVEVLQK